MFTQMGKHFTERPFGNLSDHYSNVGGANRSPLFASTETHFENVKPAAFDCLRVIFVREGSAILFRDSEEFPLKIGDVILVCPNVMCGCEPEGDTTVTTVYLDNDYIMDQVFWQYRGFFQHRLDVLGLLSMMDMETAQVLNLGEGVFEKIGPWLNELDQLSTDGNSLVRFYRVQALWSAVVDIINPFMRSRWSQLTLPVDSYGQSAVPRHRQFLPIREEARGIANLLREDPGHHWTLEGLASHVHLSHTQLIRLFSEAYGKTPLAYLSMVRVEELARLLRETRMPIGEAIKQVGWQSRGHAARVFREYVGINPAEYRRLHDASR